MTYIAYSTASANWVSRGATIEECRGKAAVHGPLADQFLIVFDAGPDADHIADPMQSHRLVHNLKTRCTVVWRGENDLAQRQFGRKG
jgi:hypothetical protein